MENHPFFNGLLVPFEAGLRSSICTDELVQPAPSPRITMKLGGAAAATAAQPKANRIE